MERIRVGLTLRFFSKPHIRFRTKQHKRLFISTLNNINCRNRLKKCKKSEEILFKNEE
jgi:hypothetical protein